MLLPFLLLQSFLWLSTQAMIRKINVIAGRAVFVNDNLPKQSNDDLERIASAMRNSFCEIINPEFDYEDKVRLCWLGDERICGAVRRRYIVGVPMIYVHYIEDQDESAHDSDLTEKYLEYLAQKLRKDDTQIVARNVTFSKDNTKNRHVLTNLSFAGYRRESRDGAARSRFGVEIVQRVLDRILIPIPHRIHVKFQVLEMYTERMQRMALSTSSKQSYYPLQHPALRIHLFPNEQSFIRHGGELYDEVVADPKQFVTIGAPDIRQLVKSRLFWYPEQVLHMDRFRASVPLQRYLYVELCKTLGDRQVLDDNRRLSEVIHILLRAFDSPERAQLILGSMNHNEEGLASGQEIIGKILNVLSRMNDKHHPLYGPWKKEQGETMGLEEKSKRIDIFMKVWDGIILKELVLYESDPGQRQRFWKSFGIAARGDWKGFASRNVEKAMAKIGVATWGAIDYYLDPSFSMNILLFGNVECNQALLKETCLELKYSWRALIRSVQWIDDAWEEAFV